jgi:hypothetical protein
MLATKLRGNFAPMRRSDPESLRKGTLDCFATLAMMAEAWGRIPDDGSADVTAAITSDVIALLREAIHAETTRNWEEI